MFKQVLNEQLGIDPNEVQYIDGDTDRVAFGIGTNGSRSTVIGGSALWMAADKIIAKGKKIAGASARGRRGRHRIRRRRMAARSSWPAPTGACRSPMSRRRRSRPAQLPPGFEGGLYETGTFSPSDDDLSQRLPCLRGRDRSRYRRGRDRRLCRRRRCRHGGQPDRAQGPDPRRRRAGPGPGGHGAGRLRPRSRASC